MQIFLPPVPFSKTPSLLPALRAPFPVLLPLSLAKTTARKKAKRRQKPGAKGSFDWPPPRRCALLYHLWQEALQPPSAPPPSFPPIRFDETARPRKSPSASSPSFPPVRFDETTRPRKSPTASSPPSPPIILSGSLRPQRRELFLCSRQNKYRKEGARQGRSRAQKSSPPTLFCVSRLLGSQRN